MVYLAELLVVMTDGRKIDRICARNVPHTWHTWTQALIDDDVFLASLTPLRKRRCRVLDAPGCHPVETQKYRLQTTCECLAVASKEESCHDRMPSSL